MVHLATYHTYTRTKPYCCAIQCTDKAKWTTRASNLSFPLSLNKSDLVTLKEWIKFRKPTYGCDHLHDAHPILYLCSALTTCSACKACSIFCFIDEGVIAASAIFKQRMHFPSLRVCSLYIVGVTRRGNGKRLFGRERVWIQLCIETRVALTGCFQCVLNALVTSCLDMWFVSLPPAFLKCHSVHPTLIHLF